MRIHVLNICYKKGGSTTNVQSYTPTEQEIRLQKAAADYSEAIAPNALWLNTVARNVLQDSLGTIQVDYNTLAQNATQQAQAAQQGVAGLTQGVLPTAYQQNMEASLMSGVNNTVGSAINNLAQRGVLNSSVTNKQMSDISKNVSDTMAQQYQNNIGVLNGLYGQQSQLAGAPITLNAAAQEAAQQPAINLWNASLGLNSGGTLGALNAVSGQGTTTSTTNTSGGTGFLGSLFSGAANSAAAAWACFVADTLVTMADGAKKTIKDIKLGDKVLSFNPATLEDTVAEVTAIMEPKESEVVEITCINMFGHKFKVRTTLTQPLLIGDGEFARVSKLKYKDELVVVDGGDHIAKIEEIASVENALVYDIKVSGVNTYYANDFIAKGGVNEW